MSRILSKPALLDIVRGLVDEIDRCEVKVSEELEGNARAALASAESEDKAAKAREIFVCFEKLLRLSVSAKNYREIIRRNQAETDVRICHSHDFVDANMIMAGAFLSVVGRDIDLQSEEDIKLFNDAWEIFRSAE